MNIHEGPLAGYRIEGELRLGNKVSVLSPSGSSYEVEVAADGKSSCTCPAHHFRGRCKHTDFLRAHTGGRGVKSRAQVQAILTPLLAVLQPLSRRVEVSGSFRRGCASFDSLLLLAVADPDAVLAALKAYAPTRAISMVNENHLTSMVDGLLLDIYFTVPEAWGAAQMFYTGPKELNIAQRGQAKARDFKLSEWGLFKRTTEEYVAGREEAEVYLKMGWNFMTPEEREAYITVRSLFGGR